MARKRKERATPTGFLRFVLRLPIWLYRWRLGWLLGGRFLLVHHTGAKSGLPRNTVLEVVRHDAAAMTWTLASGFGAKSHWYKNLRKTPDCAIEFGRKRYDVRAQFPSDKEGGEVMAEYAQRNPGAARGLMKFCGYEVDGSEADYREVATLGLKFIVLSKR